MEYICARLEGDGIRLPWVGELMVEYIYEWTLHREMEHTYKGVRRDYGAERESYDHGLMSAV